MLIGKYKCNLKTNIIKKQRFNNKEQIKRKANN